MRLIFLLVFVVAAFIGIAFYCIKPQEHIVLFNKEALQGQLIRQLAEHQATAAQVELATSRFNDSLSQLLTSYAKRHGVVILERKIAFAGGTDITSKLTAELSELMRKKS